MILRDDGGSAGSAASGAVSTLLTGAVEVSGAGDSGIIDCLFCRVLGFCDVFGLNGRRGVRFLLLLSVERGLDFGFRLDATRSGTCIAGLFFPARALGF